MAVMAAPKPKTDESSKEPVPGRTPLRVDDARLLDALDTFAKRQRRSRNMALQIILEEKMEAEGLWPPPRPH